MCRAMHSEAFRRPACRLLRPRRKRPRCSRTAEKRDELAPPHSITSSARGRSDVGTSAEHSGGLEIDHHLERGRLHHR